MSEEGRLSLSGPEVIETVRGAGKGHGTRDMPIWGKEYLIEESQRLREARGAYDAPAVVRARILTLLEYISRIQVR